MLRRNISESLHTQSLSGVTNLSRPLCRAGRPGHQRVGVCKEARHCQGGHYQGFCHAQADAHSGLGVCCFGERENMTCVLFIVPTYSMCHVCCTQIYDTCVVPTYNMCHVCCTHINVTCVVPTYNLPRPRRVQVRRGDGGRSLLLPGDISDHIHLVTLHSQEPRVPQRRHGWLLVLTHSQSKSDV